jgi:hypothetical protein
MSTHGEALEDIKKAKNVLDSSNIIRSNKKFFTHKNVSLVKSGLRIIACGFLAYYEIQTAAVLFLLAEFLGVAEELV